MDGFEGYGAWTMRSDTVLLGEFSGLGTLPIAKAFRSTNKP
jgi:hypothetical protein